MLVEYHLCVHCIRLFLQCMCVCAYAQTFLILCDPWTVACQSPLAMKFSRQEYWSQLPFPTPGDPRNPGIEPAFLVSPALAGRLFTIVLPCSKLIQRFNTILMKISKSFCQNYQVDSESYMKRKRPRNAKAVFNKNKVERTMLSGFLTSRFTIKLVNQDNVVVVKIRHR